MSAFGELERMASVPQIRSVTTAQALTAEIKSNNRRIAQTLQTIQSDLRLLSYRMNS